MIPLSDFVDDARRFGEVQFCARHAAPFLIHWTSPTAQVIEPRNTGMGTFERLVLNKPGTITERSVIENYQVAALRTTRPSRRVWVGYSNQCDIVVNDSSVSRVHAYFVDDRGWRVEDAVSSAGTLINDRPVTTTPLRSGDRVTLGAVDLLFLEPTQLYRLIYRIELF